jgi:dTDP-4-dehydrorhamnose reductase
MDAADAVMDMVLDEAPPGIWHVVNSGAATWFEFAEQIVSDTDVNARVLPITTEQFPTPAARPRYSALDNGKVSKTVRAMRPWQDALKDYLVAKGHRQKVLV